MLQALRALLRFLVAAELSARLQRAAGAPAEGEREQQWRVKCAELLADVQADLAALKVGGAWVAGPCLAHVHLCCAAVFVPVSVHMPTLVRRLHLLRPQEAGIGRYCPQVLADYVVLAAAPPSAKSKALLAFSSPAATQQRASGSASAAAAAGAAAAEEDVLSGEPLGPEVAAALRRGAYTLFSACSPGEVSPGGVACGRACLKRRTQLSGSPVRAPASPDPHPCMHTPSPQVQFLYASLGSSGGQRGGGGAVASWRGALAGLKAGFEHNHKYTGKV